MIWACIAGSNSTAQALPANSARSWPCRIADHVGRQLIIHAAEQYSNACGGEDILIAQLDRCREHLLSAIGYFTYDLLIAYVIEQNRELIATQPRGGIARPQALLQPARDRDQELVADRVSKAVVYRS